jgi:hypothetical protein
VWREQRVRRDFARQVAWRGCPAAGGLPMTLLRSVLYPGGTGKLAHHFASAGTSVALEIEAHQRYVGIRGRDIRFVDLRSRKVRWQAPASANGGLEQLVAGRSGVVAWVTRSTWGAAIGAARSRVSITLDRDTTVDPGSLAVSATRVTWTVAGQPRSFSFPPR